METEPELRAKLEAGWDWIKRNPDDPRVDEFFGRWEHENIAYMDTYGITRKPGVTLPEPSPWIEELREQLILGGLADVEEKRKEKKRVKD